MPQNRWICHFWSKQSQAKSKKADVFGPCWNSKHGIVPQTMTRMWQECRQQNTIGVRKYVKLG